MNFTAHHDAKFSHGVGQAGGDHCQVTARGGQPHRGHRLEGPRSARVGWPLCRPPQPSLARAFHSSFFFFASLMEKSRDDFLMTALVLRVGKCESKHSL